MPTYTTNYDLAKPLVNSAVDQDLWGDELNNNMDIIDTTMKSISDAISAGSQLPIGSLYWNKTNSNNPSTYLGYGTWVAITDKFVIARGSTYTSTGGVAEQTLIEANLPSHRHYMAANTNTSTDPANPNNVNVTSGQQVAATNYNGSIGGEAYTMYGTSTDATVGRTSAVGSSTPFSIIPPYQAAYCWERTA